MAQKVELRKRSGSTFSGNDNLMLPVTHVNFVLGLLDGNSKLNTSLLPSSMLNTKRMAGSINADTTFAALYTLIGTFNESAAAMYPGTYFISNGKNLISASTDHVVYYNDDSLPASSTVNLENGDHLFYVKYGSEYAWNDTAITVNPTESAGISSLSAPYNTISGSNVFYDESALAATNPTASGTYALLTGYRWVPSNVTEYNAAGYKIIKTASIGGTVVEADANYLVVPSRELWDYGQWDVALGIDDTGSGVSYWRLTQVMATPPTLPMVYQSIVYSNKHIWGVVNNTYDLATTDSAGLMSATDKVKLNGLSNYVHHSQPKIDLDTSGIEVVDTLTINTQGHTTAASKRSLPNASTSAAGVMSAADKTKLDGIAANANNYSHPTQTAIDVNATDDGQSVIDRVVVNTLGHVTSVTTRNLSSATTSASGVVELATSTEAITGTDSTRALTASASLAQLNYHQDMSYFTDLTSANAATLPDGATAMIVTGTITI